MNGKRFIEESFPVKEVSIESAKEKNIRHGHISTLHIWWARRPLASSRATNYAALIPAPDTIEEWDKKRRFIIDFSKWENSLNQSMIEQARKDILKAYGGKPPKVLDPFGGGGAIPLEALRLGCETYSNDLNPVAVLIQKCTLEYPQKYGKPGEVEREVEEFGKTVKKKIKISNLLVEDVKYWGNWILKESKKEIGKFYPTDSNGFIPVGYIWAKTIRCQNPSCGVEIPLMRQFWLANKRNKNIALYPYVENKTIKFKILGEGHEKISDNFDPNTGNVVAAVVNCLVCGFMIDDDTTRNLFQKSLSNQRLVAVVLTDPKRKGKIYRIPNKLDIDTYNLAEIYLNKKIDEFKEKWGFDPIPDEPLPTPTGGVYGEDTDLYFNFRCILYGIVRWGNIFNNRQKLLILIFTDKIKTLWDHWHWIQKDNQDYAKAVITYLSFAFTKLTTENNILTRWNIGAESFAGKPDQDPRLSMKWNYAESNPFSNFTGSYINHIKGISKAIENISEISPIVELKNYSATEIPYSDNFFDAIFTDPPYYDNYAYSDLSDYFYVLFKRVLGDIYPDLFFTSISPRSKEIIENLSLLRGMSKEKAYEIKSLNLKSKEFLKKILKKHFRKYIEF